VRSYRDSPDWVEPSQATSTRQLVIWTIQPALCWRAMDHPLPDLDSPALGWHIGNDRIFAPTMTQGARAVRCHPCRNMLDMLMLRDLLGMVSGPLRMVGRCFPGQLTSVPTTSCRWYEPNLCTCEAADTEAGDSTPNAPKERDL
jgi:hypothetical protein